MAQELVRHREMMIFSFEFISCKPRGYGGQLLFEPLELSKASVNSDVPPEQTPWANYNVLNTLLPG